MVLPRRLAAGLSALAAAAMVLAAAGCTSGGPPTASGDEGSIVLVHTQAAGDGSVIDSQLAGLKSVGEELGYETSSVYADDPATFQSTLQNIVDTEPTVVISAFPPITDALIATAEANPDVKFIHLYADPLEPALDNLLTVSYDYYAVMYLSGVYAATITDTGKIGWIGGDTQPLALADYNAFAAGAASVAPEVEVLYGFVGSYEDTAKAQEVANQLFNAGVDVLQTDAGGADSGVLASAQQAPGRYVLSGGVIAFETAPDVTLAAAVADYAASVQETVPMVLDAGFSGGDLVTSIGEVIKLVFNPEPPADPDSAVLGQLDAGEEAVATTTQSVAEGSETIPFDTKAP